MSRRSVLAGTVGIGAASIAGCVGDRDLNFDTNPSRFNPVVVAETPYSMANARQINLGELIREMTEISADFDAESYFVQYAHDQLPQLVVNFSTPSITAFDRQLNPIATSNTERILNLLFGAINRSQDSGVTLENFEKTNEEDIETSLGIQTLETFEVEAESEQFGTIYYTAYIVKHELEDAVLLTTGLTIRDIEGLEVDFTEEADAQRETVVSILEAPEYPVDWEADVLSQLDGGTEDDSEMEDSEMSDSNSSS